MAISRRVKKARKDGKRVHESKKVQVKGEGEGKGEQLLPGIPNEITLDQVAPKLPWTAFHVLSSVSRGWQQAIQSRRVYDARVRSQSTETVVVLQRYCQAIDRYQIILYSQKNGSCYHLPAIPRLPWKCKCVSMDGKLYRIGGLKTDLRGDVYDYETTGDVYMLDLAGQREWKQCASMQFPRTGFGCGVIKDKIYVFGGSSGPMPVCESEVYDPKEDAWSSIMPMKSFRFDHKVTTVGEELFAHSGLIYDTDIFESAGYGQVEIDPCGSEDDPYHSNEDDPHFEDTYSAEVYHPLKDEWRSVEHFSQSRTDKVLMVGGKLHKATPLGIYVYDMNANSWKLSQTFSFDVIGPRASFSIHLLAVVPVDAELYAEVQWRSFPVNREGTRSCGIWHMRSQGLGVENKEIVWQKAEGSLSFENLHLPVMCLIQL